MATQKEFEIISKMYHRALGKALIKIDKSIEEAKEKHGFENGSALTNIYINHLDTAMEGIDSDYDLETGKLIYNQKDTLKMLKAIDHIITCIL